MPHCIKKEENFPCSFYKLSQCWYQSPTKITQERKLDTNITSDLVMKNSKWNIDIWYSAGQFSIANEGFIIYHINSCNTSYVLAFVLSALSLYI